MIFNSIDFAIFLPIVFILYWFFANKNLRTQNLLIVVASYVFYGWWDWRFLFLILFSSVVDYLVGVGLAKYEKQNIRKLLLVISIVVNLGFLVFFKYYNFFLDNFVAAFSFFGIGLRARSLSIVLPVGISFYTFQTLSYSIDVYRKRLEPTRDFIAFCSFVSFFPQLVAGPIERATHLLPQFRARRTFSYAKAVDGLRQILWGLLKKIVIADNCAKYVNIAFNNVEDCSGSTLVFGALFFAIQIYCDFSGYSDIAIGTSRLFGFDLMRNFAFPYFSRDIAEFWRRWHISLSTWFRDYLYIPLGGSRGSSFVKVRNVFVIFIISGLWHGANWTFVIWGALNALYFLPLLLLNKNRGNVDNVASGRKLPGVRDVFDMLFTFGLVVVAWVFFRAESIGDALKYFSGMFSRSLLTVPYFCGARGLNTTMVIVVVFMVVEWLGREQQHPLVGLGEFLSKPVRWSLYIMLILIIYFFGNFSDSIEFIYFQF